MTATNSPRVCIIGAGIGGICAGIQLTRLMKLNTFTIYERNEDVGGVWQSNKYPGCANDTPSVVYTYSFAPKGDFPNSYATNKETCDYLRDTAIYFNVYPRIEFNTEVASLEWVETMNKWKATVVNKQQNNSEEVQLFDIVICSTGPFHNPKYPTQFLSFKGPIIHTAEWDNTVELANKVVAIIGSGASAVQLIPAIVDKVQTLHCFQRSPNWNMLVRPNFKMPKIVKWTFTKFPCSLWMTRSFIFLFFEAFWIFLRSDWKYGKKMESISKAGMRRQIRNNDQLIEDITPNFKLGCKRTNLSNDYFPAITRPNVLIHKETITEVKDEFLTLEDGQKIKIDVLVLATGYEVDRYFAPLQIIGKNKRNILNEWQNSSPSTYFSVVTNSMPNLFMLEGPHSDSGHHTAVVMLEMQVMFAIRILQEKARRQSRCVTVKESAEREFMEDLKKWLKRMVQDDEECVNYYRNSRKETTTLWPLTMTHYWLKTRFIDFSKFEFS